MLLLALLGEIGTGMHKQSEHKFDSIILDHPEDVKNLFHYLENHPSENLVIDVETDSSSERKAKLYGIALCADDQESFYIPIRRPDTSFYWDVNISSLIQQRLFEVASKKKLIMHNGIYDILVIENNYGYDLTPYLYCDTILLKHSVDEERPFGLKETAVKYLGDWADKSQKELYDNIKANGGRCTKEHMEMYKADTAILGNYATWDVQLTLLLFNKMSPMLEAEGLVKFFYEDEVMPLYKEVVIPMKRHGFHIDVTHFERLSSELAVEIDRLEKEIMVDIAPLVTEYEDIVIKEKLTITPRSEVGKLIIEKGLGYADTIVNDKGKKEKVLVYEFDKCRSMLLEFYKKKQEVDFVFNLTSNHHLGWLFFEKLGIKPTEFTETGRPKLNAETLDELSTDNPFAKKIIDMKKLIKLKSTYVDGILELQEDGVIHTSYLMFGTTSGRFSSTRPNLQNLPRIKDDESTLSPVVLKYTNEIKKGFVAKEGCILIGTDYSQLEPCAFSEASGDAKLQEVFIKKHDLYSAIAVEAEGLQDIYTADKKSPNYLKNHRPELRQRYKVVSLAVVYGSGAGRISQLLGVEKDTAQRIIDNYMNAYPGLKSYIESCHELLFREGVAVSKFGRIRHLKEAKWIYKVHGEKVLNYKYAQNNGLAEVRKKLKNFMNLSTNHPIQSVASSVCNRAMIAIARRFKEEGIDGHIISQTHDEITCDINLRDKDRAAEIIQDCMENTTKLAVPLIAEPAIGFSWAEAK
jgi:DNA polymerase I-like protein with 3'-5' exonuclease and polymerase domains